MANRHPNFRKMQAAVARWIEECKARPDGAQQLRGRIAWFEKNLTDMGRDRIAPAFEGLTCFDVLDSIDELRKALDAMTVREAA